jgi:uncharacterized protein
MNKKLILFLIILIFFIFACVPASPSFVEQDGAIATTEISKENVSVPTVPPLQTNLYSLESLRDESYGLGTFNVEYAWERQKEFVRYKVNYVSDGLTIHGFVNIPGGKGPFPVVIALHGFVSPDEYETLDYSTRYADSIARKGYIVLHPNLRNFPPSDSAPRSKDYYSGYVIDVMNMLAYVRTLAEQPGIFENADLTRLGVWGHSMGGGMALRLTGLIDDIQAAVIYAGVSQRYTNASTGINIFDYEASNAAYSVHHGTSDSTISVEWSRLLCLQLRDAGKKVTCFYYEDQPHTFYKSGDADALFIDRTIEFFDSELKFE